MPIFQNYVLIAALIAWGIAQLIKVPLEYLQTHHWNWALFVSPGGMPSSHSALIVGDHPWDRSFSRFQYGIICPGICLEHGRHL